MKKTPTYLLLLIYCILPMQLFSFDQSIFNSNLSESERIQLVNGERLVRNIEKVKKMSLTAFDNQSKILIDSIVALKPKYLVEIIQVLPYEGNQDVFSRLQNVLIDVQGYVGIPYYSVRNQKYFDLYEKAVIHSEISNEHNGITTTKTDVTLTMEPFGDIRTDILIQKTDNSLFFESINMEKITASGITAVGEKKMKSFIYAFRSGDSIVLYGIGGIDAPTIFFLKDRLETSFVNRIKDFCAYVFKQIQHEEISY